jgi:hypothetical protein
MLYLSSILYISMVCPFKTSEPAKELVWEDVRMHFYLFQNIKAKSFRQKVSY